MFSSRNRLMLSAVVLIAVTVICLVIVAAKSTTAFSDNTLSEKEWIGRDRGIPYLSEIQDDDPKQSVEYCINGEKMRFSYVKSVESRQPDGFFIDEPSPVITIDYYCDPEGRTVTKNKNSDSLASFDIGDTSKLLSGNDGLPYVTEDEAIEIAKRIIKSSDISISDIENADCKAEDTGDFGKYYYVSIKSSDGIVDVTLSKYGKLRGFSYLRLSDISEDCKVIARDKINSRISELQKDDPNTVYEIEGEQFVVIGDRDYARFTVKRYSLTEDDYDCFTYACYA